MTEPQSEMTLDPPGRIAVIGAGPLGLEAALYGRFLGYDVTVFERGEVGQSLREQADQPLPMLPSACLSPLAWSALSAQHGGGSPWPSASLPLTIGQWLDQGLQPLASSDLLRSRVWTGHEVTGIELVEVALDDAEASESGQGADVEEDDEYVDGDVPADFRLSVRWDQQQANYRSGSMWPADAALDFEAVIQATGYRLPTAIAGLEQCASSPYFFRLGGDAPSDSTAADPASNQVLLAGWREIVRIYAQLGGRSDLDLYRPLRV
jgi:hypothetical protein